MTLSPVQSILIIVVCAACTFLERALPFLIFGNRPVPPVVKYLGKLLPVAVMATLVVYCVRDVSFTSLASCVPSVVSVALVVAVHLWKRNTFLSVVAGTVCYMLLIRCF